MLILLAALAGMAVLATRRPVRRIIARACLLVLVLGVAAAVAVLVAGSHWPLVAAAMVVLAMAAIAWRVLRWARAVRVLAIARWVWWGWQTIVELRDAHSVSRSRRAFPARPS